MSRQIEIEYQIKELKRIREKTGLNRTRFCEEYGIPLRSMEQWEAGQRKMPDYVLRLLKYHVLVNRIVKRKRYFDASGTDKAIAFVVEGVPVEPAGTTVYAMPTSDNNDEYRRTDEEHGLHFVFEDDIPETNFYAVPRFDIFAVDDEGGFLGMVGDRCDLETGRPILYVSASHEVFELAYTGDDFVKHLFDWNVGMRPSDSLAIFDCKEDAEQVYDFIIIKEGI